MYEVKESSGRCTHIRELELVVHVCDSACNSALVDFRFYQRKLRPLSSLVFVLAGSRNMVNSASRNGFYEGDEWQETDFWYNRVMDARDPASHIANPSALALITFGLTTALLQVGAQSALPHCLQGLQAQLVYRRLAVVPKSTGRCH